MNVYLNENEPYNKTKTISFSEKGGNPFENEKSEEDSFENLFGNEKNEKILEYDDFFESLNGNDSLELKKRTFFEKSFYIKNLFSYNLKINVEWFKYFLMLKENFLEIFNNGTTPLSAYLSMNKNINLEVVDYLVEELKIDFQRLGQFCYWGNSYLHSFSENFGASLEIVEYFVNKKMNFGLKNNKGITPFHSFCERNKLEIVKYLLDRGENYLNVQNENGDTPLHLITNFNNYLAREKFILFISHKAKIDIKDKEGLTCKEKLIRDDKNDVMKLFFKEIENGELWIVEYIKYFPKEMKKMMETLLVSIKLQIKPLFTTKIPKNLFLKIIQHALFDF
eukprot:TRINITY_DN11951_c0_g1_i1.p1 TRINITY_DN11951_c0_g1~~TRINITY_DN11951_c0_g1_i1.p1  ORF type:complete len:367 (-),score=99.95 TRINITY_DN11951_c0_g1_i1:64-1074(-)